MDPSKNKSPFENFFSTGEKQLEYTFFEIVFLERKKGFKEKVIPNNCFLFPFPSETEMQKF